jgi:LysM repeat protein
MIIDRFFVSQYLILREKYGILEGMKQHTYRDIFPKAPKEWVPLRKIGLFSVPVALTMLVMYCSQKVNSILDDHQKNSLEYVAPELSQTEQEDVTKSWNEAQENQVLMVYRVKKWDTLSQIARKHGVTLESILKINQKITQADAIKINQAILIPYDGQEEIPAETFETTGTAVPLTFTKSSLTSIMRDVLTRPEWTLLAASESQPSDASRLKVIAEKAGLGKDVSEVRYANLCAANMRAVWTSLKSHLQDIGVDIDLGWSNGKNGIGVGKYFADLSARKKLPKWYQVITTKSNPDPEKLKNILLSKWNEYSIFVLSYSHEVDGHVNIAFRVGDDIIIFDPSWKGKSLGWPERFHKFEDYMDHFVLGEKTTWYTKQRNRYDLYNVTCVPAHRIDVQKVVAKKTLPEKAQRDDWDMKGLTMVFEGFTPRMKIDTQDKNKVTYAIGYGTNIGTLQTDYPFGSNGEDVAEYLKKRWHNTEDIKQIMHCKKDISRSEARDLFEIRYIPRYQKMRVQCGKNWNAYPPVIRNMLVDMSYNMGEFSIFPHGDSKWFPDAVSALNRGDWVAYINAVVDSKYARDVGARRLGKWIALVVRDVLKGKTSGLSQEALDMYSTYTTKHSRDLSSQMAKLD